MRTYASCVLLIQHHVQRVLNNMQFLNIQNSTILCMRLGFTPDIDFNKPFLSFLPPVQSLTSFVPMIVFVQIKHNFTEMVSHQDLV